MALPSTIAAIVVAAVCVVPAPATAQQLLQDSKLGFKLRAPNDFNKVPLQNDEEWIIARWISNRTYYAQEKGGFTTDQKVELSVMAFPTSKSKVKTDGENPGAIDLTKSTVIFLKSPYKDYQSYLKATFHEGGYYVAKDDKAEVEGIQVQTLDIKVEKLVVVPKKVLTWIFKCDDAEFAVQFEMVEAAYPKLKGDIEACMKTFRRIPKDANAAAGSGAGTRPVIESTGEMTPAQRAARRRDQETQAQEKYTKGLTEGWTSKKYGRVFILNHADEKYAATTAANANAILDFLDANFGFLGPGEYVRAPVIRICKDFDEMHLYDKGGGSGPGVIVSSGDAIPEFIWDREITTYKDTYNAGAQWGEPALEEVFIHWMSEHDQHAFGRLPFWLRIGLERAFRMSKAKGGKLEFFNDSDERVAISQASHASKLTKFEDLVKMDYASIGPNRSRAYECTAAARYLLTGPKRAKDAMQAYVVAVGKIARRDEEEFKKSLKSAGSESKPKTIEDEDAKFKEQNSKRANAEKANLEEVFKAAFGTWSDADWKSFQSAYEKSLN